MRLRSTIVALGQPKLTLPGRISIWANANRKMDRLKSQATSETSEASVLHGKQGIKATMEQRNLSEAKSQLRQQVNEALKAMHQGQIAEQCKLLLCVASSCSSNANLAASIINSSTLICMSKADLCVKALQQLPEWKTASRIGVYLSIPNREINTRGIISAAFDEKKKVFIPRVDGKTMEMVQANDLADIDLFPRNRFKIAEPPPSPERLIGMLQSVPQFQKKSGF